MIRETRSEECIFSDSYGLWESELHQFQIGCHLYQFSYLPFRMKSASWYFTKVMRLVAAWLNERGVRLITYMDDFLITLRI